MARSIDISAAQERVIRAAWAWESHPAHSFAQAELTEAVRDHKAQAEALGARTAKPATDHCGKNLPVEGHGLVACGEPVEYIAATPPEVPYSGWRHTNRTTDTDHLPVPKGWLS
jgi:hypothetical protein